MTAGDINLNDLDGPPETLLAGVRNGAWLDQQVIPPLRYHVPAILPEGLTVLAGAPKVGKSWLVLGLLLAAASGGTALGAVPLASPADTLYLALEDGDRRMQSRCRALLGNAWRPDDPIPARFEYLLTVEPGQLLATVTEWLEGHPAGLVVVDTLGKMLPPAAHGETAYSRDYRITSSLKTAADAFPGAAVLVNHHDRKATTADFVDAVSGTNGIAGAADTVLVLTRPREDPAGLIQVTGRDVTEAAYALTFDRGTWTLDGGSLDAAAAAARQRRATAGLAGNATDIARYVTGRDTPVTPSEVAEELNIDSDAAGKYLRRLAAAGRITKHGRGSYAPLSEASEVSERQVRPPKELSDTVSEVSERPPEPPTTALIPRVDEQARLSDTSDSLSESPEASDQPIGHSDTSDSTTGEPLPRQRAAAREGRRR